MTNSERISWRNLDEKLAKIRGKRDKKVVFNRTLEPMQSKKKNGVTREEVQLATEKYLKDGGSIKKIDTEPHPTEKKVAHKFDVLEGVNVDYNLSNDIEDFE